MSLQGSNPYASFGTSGNWDWLLGFLYLCGTPGPSRGNSKGTWVLTVTHLGHWDQHSPVRRGGRCCPGFLEEQRKR